MLGILQKGCQSSVASFFPFQLFRFYPLSSEMRLIRLTFWDTLWEQFGLSDQSALIDASLWRKPFKTCANPQAHNVLLSRANRYENEMV